ncbi:hypothetical protein BC826DRAFT_1080659 [Russula brevipes]|nr:hypothetical protein BC826DRAFT_1080659 [Russula brevipes]
MAILTPLTLPWREALAVRCLFALYFGCFGVCAKGRRRLARPLSQAARSRLIACWRCTCEEIGNGSRLGLG